MSIALEVSKETEDQLCVIYDHAVKIVRATLNRLNPAQATSAVDTAHVYLIGDNVYRGTPVAVRIFPTSVHMHVSVFGVQQPRANMLFLLEFTDVERRRNDRRIQRYALHPFYLIFGARKGVGWTCYAHVLSAEK